MLFRTSSVILLFLVLLLSLVQGGFQYAPVLSSFAKDEGTGSYDAAARVCGDAGGYLGTEPTSALHQTHTELGYSKSGATWYAFLGGDATTPDGYLSLCPDSKLSSTSGTTMATDVSMCYYRWNTGRWRELTDSVSSVSASAEIYRSGIIFYRGTQFQQIPVGFFLFGCAATNCYPVNDFPSFFPPSDASNVKQTALTARPGMDSAHYVILVGNGTASSWSDNEATGGYVYYNITPTTKDYTGIPKFNDYSSTMPDFIAVCDAQAPSRVMLEPYKDPHSNSNLVWWVIFLVVLFVVCLIVFIIIACCQERENEEEPPEDAPQWAQEEATTVQRPRRYVSQKNFVTVRNFDDEEGYEEMHREGSAESCATGSSGDETGSSQEGHRSIHF